MIRAVLDTNVLTSGALTSDTAVARVDNAGLNGAFEIVLSEPILAELERTLRKPYFLLRLGETLVSAYISQLRLVASMTGITNAVHGIASHSEDDVIIATAVSGRTDYLVTGDRDLQALKTYHGVQIVSPYAFLAYLGQV